MIKNEAKLNTGILIQARMSSARFPGKMLNKLGDFPLVEFVYRRCLESKKADMVAVITSTDPSDDKLYNHCVEQGLNVYRGDLENVLLRYTEGAEHFKLDTVVRVCGDSPFVDVEKIDEMLSLFERENLDYMNFDKTTILWGLDSEIVKTSLLKEISTKELLPEDKEHVTLFIKKTIDQYKTKSLKLHHSEKQVNEIKLTVDYPKDLELCQKLLKHFAHKKFKFTSVDIDDALSKELKACAE